MQVAKMSAKENTTPTVTVLKGTRRNVNSNLWKYDSPTSPSSSPIPILRQKTKSKYRQPIQIKTSPKVRQKLLSKKKVDSSVRNGAPSDRWRTCGTRTFSKNPPPPPQRLTFLNRPHPLHWPKLKRGVKLVPSGLHRFWKFLSEPWAKERCWRSRQSWMDLLCR